MLLYLHFIDGNGNPFQCSCLGNLMDRGVLWATVHGVTRVGHNLAIKPLYLNYNVLASSVSETDTRASMPCCSRGWSLRSLHSSYLLENSSELWEFCYVYKCQSKAGGKGVRNREVKIEASLLLIAFVHKDIIVDSMWMTPKEAITTLKFCLQL